MRLPDLRQAADAHTAASLLVQAGWAVVPVSQGDKSPGSLLGKDWPNQSARTPADVDRLWARFPDSAVAIHHGGSWPPTVAIDVDKVELAPSDLLHALTETRAFVSSRDNDADRGHHLFLVPAGRELSNSPAGLYDMGLDVKTGNAVTVAWGRHKKASDGGRYLTEGGDVAELPEWIACRLRDRGITGQADDEQVQAFLAALPGGTCPEIANRVRDGVAELLAAKASHDRGGPGRHESGLAIVKGLVRLGERRFPGVREALADIESAFLAGRERGFGGRADWASNLPGAVGAVTKDPSPASEHFVDIEPMLAAISERKQKERAVVDTASTIEQVDVHGRRLKLTPASQIKPRPVHWLWTGRMPLGALTLCAGREGIGKSSAMYEIAAQITRGELTGDCLGTPRAVIVCATEDSWEHTIVPRLMAAKADRERVFRVEVETTDTAVELTLPKDHAELEAAITETSAALVLLDPLMSRVDAKIDTHNDQQTRQALEPLVKVADRTRCAVAGLIHLNKSKPDDILTAVMGSRAFSAVARSVLAVQTDPDDERTALLGVAKANLTSKLDVPQLAFRIESVHVADTDEGPVEAGRLVWTGERAASVADTFTAAGEDPETRTLVADAAAWLVDFLTGQGGSADTADIRAAHERDRTDFSFDAVKRARKPARVTSTRTSSVPSRTRWTLQSVQSGHPLTAPTAPTALTAPTGADQGRHT